MKSLSYLLSFLAILVLLLPAPATAQLFEDFEDGTKGGYAAGTVQLSSGAWMFDEALIGSLDSDKKIGSRAARIRNGHIGMQFDIFGAGDVRFHYAHFSNDSGSRVQLQYSEDEGSSWSDLGDELQPGSELVQAQIEANIDGNVRFRIVSSEGSDSRINIDNFEVTEFVEDTEDPRLRVEADGSVIPTDGNIDFRNVLINRTAGKTLSLINTGQQDLEIASLTVSGNGFSLSGDIPSTLEPSESSELELSFEPEAAGDANGTLTILSNDPDVPEFEVALAGSGLDPGDPIDIADARDKPQGTLVSVSGWVTVSNQFAGPVYFQDETGGIAWYNNEKMREDWLLDLQIGDSIVVTGYIGEFNNMIQIVDDEGHVVFPESANIIEPEVITLQQLNTGDYEGELVHIENLEFKSTGLFSAGTNYDVTDATGEGAVRADNFTDIGGRTIPSGPANITGMASRFMDTRQLIPRFYRDIREAIDGPSIVTSAPYEVSATDNSITFEWSTEEEGHSEVRYGSTRDLEMGSVSSESRTTDHSITIDNLEPASVYKIQIRSAADADTSFSNIHITSTASPSGTTGEILAYFNKSVNHTLAKYREANAYVDFRDKLIERIDNAEDTAELAFYSISGSVGDDIADAIMAAQQRDVHVRVIASGHTGTTNNVISNLQSSGVHAVQSLGREQQHNKFAIFDAHHEDPTKSWVVTSSWNATDSGTNNQFQNMLNIQDVALARAYVLEFNQMWGAESGRFNSSEARFSDNKEVVNPSVFFIGEDQTQVRLYFSPQGSTEAEINRMLATAESSIDLSLNLITRRPLSNTMRSRFNNGVKVRGVIGQITGEGSEWDYLSDWADVHEFSHSQFGLLHHKYAIIDSEANSSNSKVITGSHNWSRNADTRNDENTLIIFSPQIANEYLQEFAMRYEQAGGEGEFNIHTSSEDFVSAPGRFEVHQNYPNPFNPTTTISFELPTENRVNIRVYDALGRQVMTLLAGESLGPGVHNVRFDASTLASGIYIYRVELQDGQVFTRTLTLIK